MGDPGPGRGDNRPVSVDWVTVSSLATAGATLVVAVATFASVRSSIRVARNAERALQVGLRPVLFPSPLGTPNQIVRWGDDHYGFVGGRHALLEERGGIVYLAMPIRNVGSGIALMHGWRIGPFAHPTELSANIPMDQRRAAVVRPDVNEFRAQGIDIYVPPGDENMWLGAIRTADDPDRATVERALAAHESLFIDLMYGDQEGGQRTISRFVVSQDPADPDAWMCGVVRHWYLDREDPR